MGIKSISFPSLIEDILDIEDDTIDGFVELGYGYTSTVVVSTYRDIDMSRFDKLQAEHIKYLERLYE